MTEVEKTAKQIADISNKLKKMGQRDMVTMIAHIIRILTKDDTDALKTLALIMEQVAFAPRRKMEESK